MSSDANHDVWVDPVSHLSVDPAKSKDRSFYNGKMYHFEDGVNKKTFDEDPSLWISTPHASETSASLTPVADE